MSADFILWNELSLYKYSIVYLLMMESTIYFYTNLCDENIIMKLQKNMTKHD